MSERDRSELENDPVLVLPGVHVLERTYLVLGDFRRESVMRPTFGALDEQLHRHDKILTEGIS